MFDSSIELDPPASSLRLRSPRACVPRRPRLIALSLAMLVEMVDNSVLNVALPTIGRDLALRHERPAMDHLGLLADLRGTPARRWFARRPSRAAPRAAVGPARLRRSGRARAVRALDRRADRRARTQRCLRRADSAGDDVADVPPVRRRRAPGPRDQHHRRRRDDRLRDRTCRERPRRSPTSRGRRYSSPTRQWPS